MATLRHRSPTASLLADPFCAALAGLLCGVSLGGQLQYAFRLLATLTRSIVP
ncbi:MAG: hypothetical protein JSR73_15605 [Proteobacteria bacterium]|nr:hypothetical protein [Pseudomonadota bacterium]